MAELSDVVLELQVANEQLDSVSQNAEVLWETMGDLIQEIKTGFESQVSSIFSLKDTLKSFLELQVSTEKIETTIPVWQKMAERSENTSDEIKEGNKKQVNAISSLKDTFKRFFDFFRMQEMQDYEGKRQGKRQESIAEEAADIEPKEENKLGKFFLGFKKILAIIAAPLRFLKRLLFFGGKFVLVIGVLYTLFKVFGDGFFEDTIKQISNIWTEQILPSWERLRNIFSQFWSEGGGSERFAVIIESIRNLITDIVSIFADTIESIIDGISDIFEGNILKGIWGIVSGLGSVAIDLFDSLITNILRVFGIEFEGNSFFGAIRKTISNFISGIVENVSNIFSSIFGWIKERLGFDGERMPSIKEVLVGLYTMPMSLLTSAVNWLLERFGFEENVMPDPKDIVMSIVDSIFNIINSIRDWISDKVGSLGRIVSSLIPEPVKKLFGIKEEEPRTAEEIQKEIEDLESKRRFGFGAAERREQDARDIEMLEKEMSQLERADSPTTPELLQRSEMQQEETRRQLEEQTRAENDQTAGNMNVNNVTQVDGTTHINAPMPRAARPMSSSRDLFFNVTPFA